MKHQKVKRVGFCLLVERDEVRKRKNGRQDHVKRFRVVATGLTRLEAHAYAARYHAGKKFRIQGIRMNIEPVRSHKWGGENQ